MSTPSDPLLAVREATVRLPDGRVILGPVTLTVRAGEHWAVLGPNGAGKSTLLSLAAAQRHPTSGTVHVLGRQLGRTDLRELRAHLGVVDARLRVPALSVRDYVLTGASGTVQLAPDGYAEPARRRAGELLELVGLAALARHDVTTCSAGELARARLARALLPRPALLVLDEPAAGLDLPGREDLVAALDALAARHPALGTVTVAHHLEDLPSVTTHAALLRAGGLVAAGPVRRTLRAGPLSACFGRPLRVRRLGGRWAARGAVGLD